ncbi:MAG: hypothetical protein IJ769_04800 [Clostridia bacterium]|nr:hypothetical protein [Clostridia bacterium]
MRKTSIFRAGLIIFLMLVLWIAVGAVAHASSADAVWPEASGLAIEADGKLIVDTSHIEQGYIMCCVSAPTSHRLKVRMTYSGGGQLDYDLDNDGDYVAFPLQLGSGNYEFALYENVSGTKYSSEGKVSLQAQLVDENAAFLVPNQYVDYVRTTNAVLKSDELATQGDVYKTVCDFMTNEFNYDFVRAKTIAAGTLPEIDQCFENRAGICQDLSAVMVCMLRVQGIPAKLMIGYADRYYHAWTVAVVDGQEVFFDPTQAIGCINASKYTTERFY